MRVDRYTCRFCILFLLKIVFAFLFSPTQNLSSSYGPEYDARAYEASNPLSSIVTHGHHIPPVATAAQFYPAYQDYTAASIHSHVPHAPPPPPPPPLHHHHHHNHHSTAPPTHQTYQNYNASHQFYMPPTATYQPPPPPPTYATQSAPTQSLYNYAGGYAASEPFAANSTHQCSALTHPSTAANTHIDLTQTSIKTEYVPTPYVTPSPTLDLNSSTEVDANNTPSAIQKKSPLSTQNTMHSLMETANNSNSLRNISTGLTGQLYEQGSLLNRQQDSNKKSEFSNNFLKWNIKWSVYFICKIY